MPQFSKNAQDSSAVIYGLEGLCLSEDERDLFKNANPFGFILFKRNCDNAQQIKALTNDLKETLGRDCPILIDQEGGRVQRLAAPNWRAYPPARVFGEKAEDGSIEEALETLRFNSLQMIEDLQECGVNVNCTPVVDLLFDGAHDVIGDRAFSGDPELTARLALSVCRSYLSCGMTPIIKHIPGHGRALVDSHLELPVVKADLEDLRQFDFAAFKKLCVSDIADGAWAMSAHVVYEALDSDLPATISSKVISETIRSEIGFDGILIGDDLDMKALSRFGDVAECALKSLEAGCDLALHCSGKLEDMAKIAEKSPKISIKTLKRLQKAENIQKMAA